MMKKIKKSTMAGSYDMQHHHQCHGVITNFIMIMIMTITTSPSIGIIIIIWEGGAMVADTRCSSKKSGVNLGSALGWVWGVCAFLNVSLHIFETFILVCPGPISSPSSYPCQSVGQWLIVSDLEIGIASPSFASLLLLHAITHFIEEQILPVFEYFPSFEVFWFHRFEDLIQSQKFALLCKFVSTSGASSKCLSWE